MPDTSHAESELDPRFRTRAMSLREKSIDEANRTAVFIASTDVVDPYGESIDQASWETDAYKANPVVLFAHNARAWPIGRCDGKGWFGVKNGQLECCIEFATEDVNPEGERAWRMVRAGYIRTLSVGFIEGDYRFEKRDGREVLVLTNCSLREISLTPVPANHQALLKARTKSLLEERAKSALPPAPPKTTAPPRASAQETPMDELEKTKAALTEKDAALTEARRLNALADQSVKAAATANGELLAQRDAALKTLGAAQGETLEQAAGRIVAAHAKLEGELVERHVEGFSGVKFAPAQKEHFLALAKKDRASFDAIVEGLPDMQLLGGSVIGKAKDIAAADADGDLADDLGEPGDESPGGGDLSDDL